MSGLRQPAPPSHSRPGLFRRQAGRFSQRIGSARDDGPARVDITFAKIKQCARDS